MTMPPRPVEPGQPSDFAWQVHAALEAWLARADLKASILLAFQGGAFIVVLGRPVPLAGPALLLAAMAFAAVAVLPVLGSRQRLRRDHPTNFVYFGHLRWWRPNELAVKLDELSVQDTYRMLAEQLVRLSRMAWFKHRLIQVSVLVTAAALIAVGVSLR